MKRLLASWIGGVVVAAVCAPVAAAQALPGVQPTEPTPKGITVGVAADLPLAYEAAPATGELRQGEETYRSPRLSLTVRYAPKQRHWFGRVTFHRYLDRSRKAPWNPAFSYSFGYDNWRPNTFALTYDNGSGNRLNPDRGRGEVFTRLEEGVITGQYKIKVPESVERLFVTRPDNRLSASVGLHLTPRFHREGADTRGEWKTAASFGVRHRIVGFWFVEGRAFFYPRAGHQQAWDPDYTFSFGYFDWHPGRVAVQYGNYAGHRFPWRTEDRPPAFRDGTLTVSWSQTW